MGYPQRKHPRLKDYDYSLPGYYYVTVHIQKDGDLLSRIVPGRVILTPLGKLARQQLLALEERYAYVKIDKYIIMPTHIHAIIILKESGAIKRPDLPRIVGTFKSITTRLYHQMNGTSGRPLFQVSFYEEVLRGERAYQEAWRYIDENPSKWLLHENEDLQAPAQRT